MIVLGRPNAEIVGEALTLAWKRISAAARSAHASEAPNAVDDRLIDERR